MRARAFISVLALSSLSFAAQGAASDRKIPLVGATPFLVLVEDLRNEDQFRGQLTANGIRTSVELRLRQLGLPVVGGDTAFVFYVNVHAMTTSSQQVVYDAPVQFQELLPHPRLADRAMLVTTWSTSTLGTVPLTRSGEAIRESVVELVDEFANDYLAANPRRERK